MYASSLYELILEIGWRLTLISHRRKSPGQTKPQRSLGNILFSRIVMCSDNNSIIMKEVQHSY